MSVALFFYFRISQEDILSGSIKKPLVPHPNGSLLPNKRCTILNLIRTLYLAILRCPSAMGGVLDDIRTSLAAS